MTKLFNFDGQRDNIEKVKKNQTDKRANQKKRVNEKHDAAMGKIKAQLFPQEFVEKAIAKAKEKREDVKLKKGEPYIPAALIKIRESRKNRNKLSVNDKL